ncbi:hypothetical protein AB2B41_21285, partial [Marimonas sp. MJW-29]
HHHAVPGITFRQMMPPASAGVSFTGRLYCNRFVNGVENKGEYPLTGHLYADLSTSSGEAIILAL